MMMETNFESQTLEPTLILPDSEDNDSNVFNYDEPPRKKSKITYNSQMYTSSNNIPGTSELDCTQEYDANEDASQVLQYEEYSNRNSNNSLSGNSVYLENTQKYDVSEDATQILPCEENERQNSTASGKRALDDASVYDGDTQEYDVHEYSCTGMLLHRDSENPLLFQSGNDVDNSSTSPLTVHDNSSSKVNNKCEADVSSLSDEKKDSAFINSSNESLQLDRQAYTCSSQSQTQEYNLEPANLDSFETCEVKSGHTQHNDTTKINNATDSLDENVNNAAGDANIDNVEFSASTLKDDLSSTVSIIANSNSIKTGAKSNISKQDEAETSKSNCVVIETSATTLFDDVKTVVMKLKQKKCDKAIDPNQVYELLEANLDKSNRISIVIEALLEIYKKEASVIIISEESSDSVFAQVQKVTDQFPDANPNEVYGMLERHENDVDRVEAVVQELISKGFVRKKVMTVDLTNQEETLSEDTLVKDMLTISDMFPDQDRNEIYAYLEAHHDKPNRVQIVTNEFLRIQNPSQSASESLELPPNNATIIADDVTNESSNQKLSLETDVEMIRAIFPDCDPNYIYNSLEQKPKDKDRVERLVGEMFARRSYPKLKEVLERQNRQLLHNRLKNLQFNLTEFLQKFEDPLTLFYNEEKSMSENYKAHATTQLRNMYPMLQFKFTDDVLKRHQYHFTTTVKDLDQIVEANIQYRKRKHAKNMFVAKNRSLEYEMPEVPDDFFYHELLFTQHEQEIRDNIKQQHEVRARNIEEARIKNELQECGCCFDDELLFEDMSSCSDGHLFCKQCIRRSAEVVVGQSQTKCPCLSSDCKQEFPLSILQTVLSSNMFSNLLKKLQEEEIRQADIPDLISCPFCSFATIMSNPDDKIFICQNEECLKESCRLCKEPNHIPLHCDEVEKQGETTMRTFIENKITEAMLRTCWKCKKRFFKDFGCNKMTCTCGATMCYVCREPNINYNHFSGEGKCPPDTDVFALHKKEMEAAGKEAKAQYENDHPDTKNTQLKHDPFNYLKDLKKPVNTGEYDEDEYSSDDNDSDEDNYGGYEREYGEYHHRRYGNYMN